jgi:hypothetical protein
MRVSQGDEVICTIRSAISVLVFVGFSHGEDNCPRENEGVAALLMVRWELRR